LPVHFFPPEVFFDPPRFAPTLWPKSKLIRSDFGPVLVFFFAMTYPSRKVNLVLCHCNGLCGSVGRVWPLTFRQYLKLTALPGQGE
jgi:hypothetical protein